MSNLVKVLITKISFFNLYLIKVTLDELQTIADNLRPYTAAAMKIEVAPWTRDYVVDMKELYTQLILEEIHNTALGQDAEILENYSELFEENKCSERIDSHHLPKQTAFPFRKLQANSHRSSSKKKVGEKILMKADPGMGKTTQCKKISWDWAMRLFTYFHIVFLVFLKLVSPGHAIESVIIEQNPYMKGLEITEQKLRIILKTYSNSCLLILDGLDEHALGTNEDVLSIIRGVKLLECNILVTSRPHSTRAVEQYFRKAVRLDGFTESSAKQFASRILSDESKIDYVLWFSPEDFREDIPIYKCPILLSFLCLLVREDDIDLSDRTKHTGEIYTRMVSCLYKKFTIRRGIDFERCRLTTVLASIGKLALQTLLSGNPLLRRSDVIKEVGDDAFDYGLLIGHEEGYMLIRDVYADIYVTFPHRSLQEFLGALYFVLILQEEHQIEGLIGIDDRNWIFMKKPVFLQFCLWLLQHGEIYLDIRRGQDVYTYLRDFCVRKMGGVELDPLQIRERYTAFNLRIAYDRKDELLLTFFTEIIAQCKGTCGLIVNYDDPTDWILNRISPILKEVKFIQSARGPDGIFTTYYD